MKRSAFKRKPTPPLKRTVLEKGKKKLKKVRKDTVGKLKTKLWQLCREIIFKQHGSDCYTCPAKSLSGSNRHVGHFISSSVCSAELRYSLGNLRTQCYRCNIHLSGNWISYESHLKHDGIDVEELKQRNRETIGMKADIIYYQNKIEEYQTLLSALK